MFNTAPSQSIDQRKTYGTPFFLSVVVLSFLLTMGCKTSGNKSIVPFFGGGTSVRSPENEFSAASSPMPPAQPITVSNSPGPATPSSPASYDATSISSSTYNPPEMLPTGNAAPAPTYANNNMTMVYDVPQNTKTNSGGTAGSLPGAYSGYSGSSTGRDGTPSTSNRYDYGRASTTSRSSNSGYTYPTGSTSSSVNDTKYSSGSSYGGSDYGDSSYNGSGYGDSTPYDRYNHGPSTGHSSSLVPTGSQMEDGDYLADDGSMMRVIHGKAYELVQYINRPPILPDLPNESQSLLPTQPQNSQTSTPIQISIDYRTAVQMTESFARVPIPVYENLLDQQANGLHVVSQGVVTVAVPATTTTIIPDIAPVETVSSLDDSDYSHIGTIKVPSSLNHGTGGEVDEEMQRSIWSIMAGQNHEFLLSPQKTK